MNKKPKVGQTLYMLNINNRAIRVPQTLRPVVVTKVRRKYFTVDDQEQFSWEIKFHLDTGRQLTNFTADFAIYESEQAWEDEKESEAISRRLGNLFKIGAKLSLKQLRAIETIINTKP